MNHPGRLTCGRRVSISRRPMRRASSLLLLVGVIGALLTAAACAKSPAEAHPAEASAAKTTGTLVGRDHRAPGRRHLEARRLRQEGLLPHRQQRAVGLRPGAEPARLGQGEAERLRPLGERAPLRRAPGRPGVHRLRGLRGARQALPAGQPQEDRRLRRPDEGEPERARHAGRVRRLRVPALQELPAGAAPDPRRVPQRREALLQALPAAAAHERPAGRRGGGGRAEAGEVLAVPGQALGASR